MIYMANGQIHIDNKITADVISRIRSVFSKNFGFGVELVDLSGEVIGSDDGKSDYCKLMQGSEVMCRRCRQERLRSLMFAFKTGQPYISICHAGLVNVCVPAMENETPLGGLFFGNCLFEPLSEVSEQEILKSLSGVDIDSEVLFGLASRLPIVPARKLHYAAEFLFVMLYETAGLDPRIIQLQRSKTIQQSQISDVIQNEKKNEASFSNSRGRAYPYESEKELVEKVKIGDKTGIKEILNYILGKVLFSNPGELNILKARLIELLGMVSRSAAEGGVDIDYILEKNSGYISNIINLNTQEDICVWLSEALNSFADHVYLVQQKKKKDTLRLAVEFMEKNFRGKVTLEEIARASHLSPSRLCHVFKDRKGMTVFEYITHLRVNYAKELLISTNESSTQIAMNVGYNYQSYFDRVFKEKVGMTPKEFRKENKKTGDL